MEREIEKLVYDTHCRVQVTLIADHGNDFISRKRVDVATPLKKAGFHLTSRLKGENDVVIPSLGLLNFLSVYTRNPRVEDALVALQGDRERLARLRDAADAANNAALLARQRYASGLVDFQTVLETQRTQLSVQDNVAASLADVAGDHVRLYKALGGGWTPEAAPRENGS